MTSSLPTDIDESYPDRSDGDAAHQQHHDVLHAINNVFHDAADGQMFKKEGGELVATSGAYIAGEVVRKTADETVNNTTSTQADNELLFPIAANEVLHCRFTLIYSAAAAADLRYRIQAPSGATGDNWGDVVDVSGGNYIGDIYRRVRDLSVVLTASGAGAGTKVMGRAEAQITNGSTAGDVTLTWAQVAADASDCVVYAGSFVEVYREAA